jgi:hypothetical protein
MPLYGGRTYDDSGYQPFRVPIGNRARLWDVDVTAFSVLSLVLFAAVISAIRMNWATPCRSL